jgi:hypothetical protein
MAQGETITLNFELIAPDGRSPIDLTSLTLWWGLDLNGTLLRYKTSPDDIIINADPTTGKCTVPLILTDTEDLTPDKYHYELWQQDYLNEENKLAEGWINIKATSIRETLPLPPDSLKR